MKSLFRKFLLLIGVVFASASCFANENAALNNNSKHDLLRYLRGGDYSNAGGKEAIKLMLSHLPNQDLLRDKNILDAGSGYGGTAYYLYTKGFKKIWGADIDEQATDYANSRYGVVKFFNVDLFNVSKKFRKDYFSLITMFNVLYSVESKQTLLHHLNFVAKKGAVIAIMDYAWDSRVEKPVFDKKKDEILRDFDGKRIYPIDTSNFKTTLRNAGWKLIKEVDLSQQYFKWYEEFLSKVASERADLLSIYKEKDVEDVENLYSKLLFNIRNKRYGAVLYIAEKI